MNTVRKDYVIIVAGGKGLRMGGEVPKQFLPISGMPVLMRTIMRFHDFSSHLQIILVLPKAQHDYWLSLCEEYHFPQPVDRVGEGLYAIADGGATRFHSVQNGLALIPDDAEGVVGVHDGVRPFVSIETIRRCYDEARHSGAAIPVTPVIETIRHLSNPQSSASNPQPPALPLQPSTTVPRDEYRLVQTPQCFDVQLLKKANRQPYQDTFTDDASVVEAYGHSISLVEGNRENIKLTTPFDLLIAEVLAR